MKRTTRAVRIVAAGSGALALALGLLVWAGIGTRLVPLHELLGYVFLISYWVMATIAARAREPVRIVILTVVWGVLVLTLAIAQKELVPGARHWTIRLLHALTAIGAIALGERLASRMRHKGEASRSLRQATIGEAAAEFLSNKRIAVTGVSRKTANHGSNIVYQRLRGQNYQVFAVNPNADLVEGDRCFPDLKSIPGGVDAVLIGTRPERAMATMHECADLGIKHVWMHRSFGAGSVSDAATAWGREHGIRVIDGGCPLMFEPVSDSGHRIMRSLFMLTGKVPRRV